MRKASGKLSKTESKERTFSGLGVSPGIGLGVTHVRESGVVATPEYCILANQVENECERLMKAAKKSRRQISRLRAKARTLPEEVAEEMGLLLDAHYQMLKRSRLMNGAERRVREDRINAEAAIQAEISKISKSFASMGDSYISARIDDVREVANRLLRNLTEAPLKPASMMPKNTIVVCEELTPADAVQFDPEKVHGIATLLGGPEGHAAIMARALGIPAVMGAPDLLAGTKSGDNIIVDGGAGKVTVNPTAKTLEAYRRRRVELLEEKRRLARLRRQPAVTLDGAKVGLQANVELPVQMDLVRQTNAAGIGLLRSEFMFMNRDDFPGVEEQYIILRDMVERMAGNPVTIRTLDVGGEKIAPGLVREFGESVTSALGLRGIRLSFARPDIFENQIKAILRAGAHGPVRILLPMVSTVSEVRQARDILNRMAKRLKRRGVAIADPLPPLGAMIEVPGAALSSDALAQACDFFAIGSNDLTMYTLAIDRSDEQVAKLFNPLHPAVLRLIQFSAEAGLRARIPVSICGEMAGNPRYTALLLGLGLRELSMTASSIPKVKQRVRSMDLVAAEHRARVIMDQMDAGRIAMLLDDFNALA